MSRRPIGGRPRHERDEADADVGPAERDADPRDEDDSSEPAAVGRPAGADGPSRLPDWLSVAGGERVEWVGRPAWRSVLEGLVLGLILIPVFGLGLLIIARAVITVYSSHYAITTRGVYVKRGILSTDVEFATFDRIQNTEYSRTFVGKILGYGSIQVITAGSLETDLGINSIRSAPWVRDLLVRVAREAGGSVSDPDGPREELVAELRATREAMERVADRVEERAPPEEFD